MRGFAFRYMGSVAALLTIASLTTVAPARGGGLGFIENNHDAFNPGLDAVAASSDGANVYVAGDSLPGTLDVYERDADPMSPGFGLLTFVESHRDGVGGVDGIRGARAVAVSPDGTCVYVAGERDDAIAVFGRLPGTGTLVFVEAELDGVGAVHHLRDASGVTVSGDNQHVYASSERDDAVVVFDRNLPGCDLDFVEAEASGAGAPPDCMNQPRGVVVSNDGASVYLAGGTTLDDTGTLAVFGRNAGTGELTFVECHRDGTAGVDGLRRGTSLAMSPDDACVYVAGRYDNALAVFARTTTVGPDLGRLTFVEREKDGGGVDGLSSVHAVVVNPDGLYVYAVGRADEAVAVFRRDPESCQIAFLEVQENGATGLQGLTTQGLATPEGIAVTQDGAHVYVACRRGLGPLGTVVGFAVDVCGNDERGTDEQCDDGGTLGGDGCSATCTLELCAPTPASGCRQPIAPGQSLLRIKERVGNDNKDLFYWKWNKGALTTIADYDDPVSSDSYLVCLYDGSGAVQPLLRLSAPADADCEGEPCWERKSSKLTYKDRLATPDGIQKAELKEGLAAGKAKILIKGKGANLYFSSGGDVLGPTGLTLPVTVQATNSETGTPVCWEAVYSAAQRNDAEHFVARSD